MSNVIKRGVYNVEYYSGAQVSLYIGDIWVDEVTTLDFGYIQNRTPIFGYASTLYDDLSEGQILISGSFTINFKEAGYLWLVLDRYKTLNKGSPFKDSGYVNRVTVDKIVNGELHNVFEKNKLLQDIASLEKEKDQKTAKDLIFLRKFELTSTDPLETFAGLTGYTNNTRALGGMGTAENTWEMFEDAVWGRKGTKEYLLNRRADEPGLNPFDMYVTYGDFTGDNSVNHTIEKFKDVSIVGKSKQIVIDGMPIQERYSFIARDLI